jgi:hypothetical protein
LQRLFCLCIQCDHLAARRVEILRSLRNLFGGVIIDTIARSSMQVQVLVLVQVVVLGVIDIVGSHHQQLL